VVFGQPIECQPACRAFFRPYDIKRDQLLRSGLPTDWGDLIQIADPDISSNMAKQEDICMKKLNCKPGDLAIVVDAHNVNNIGTIVKVIRKHSNQSAISKQPDDFIWMVEAPRPMTYDHSGKLKFRKKGPAPDSILRPIRGHPLGLDIATGVRDFEKNSAS